jgi:hypothetical protein
VAQSYDNGNGTNPSYWSIPAVVTISVRFVAVVAVNRNGKAIEVTNRGGTMVEPMICDDDDGDDGLDHLIETVANESEAATPKPKKLPPKVSPTQQYNAKKDELNYEELRKITG